MKYEKIEKPSFELNDSVSVKMYTDNIAEVTQMHYDAKPDPEEMKNKHYRKPKYKTPYSLSKELKRLRESILTNILPEDIPYTYFLTITNKDIRSIEEAKNTWADFESKVTNKYGSFSSFAAFEQSKTGAYHIHALIWDSNHSKRFEFIKFESFNKFIDSGEIKVQKPKDYDGLIKIAFYITKSKVSDKIPREDNMYIISGDLKEVPHAQPFESSMLENMEELCNSSYRLYDEKNKTLDVSISRSLYINSELMQPSA